MPNSSAVGDGLLTRGRRRALTWSGMGSPSQTSSVVPTATCCGSCEVLAGCRPSMEAVVFEQVESYGMAVGREVFETVFQTGPTLPAGRSGAAQRGPDAAKEEK